MGFRKRVKFFLVHSLGRTNKDADKIIASGALSINGKIIVQNEVMKDEDEIRLDGKLLREATKYRYYALNKPPGIESTFSQKIADNLRAIFPVEGDFSVAGRLDKASEGLLLVSDDGKWVNELSSPGNFKEKEYEVETDRVITGEFLQSMSRGVDIGICLTRPCEVKQLSGNSFSIVLTEGKNRQIRRMCKKLGYEVTKLKRVRIDKFYLSDLQNLRYKMIDPG